MADALAILFWLAVCLYGAARFVRARRRADRLAAKVDARYSGAPLTWNETGEALRVDCE